ncbi:unnamed protein product [Caenorhabditis bovis]|uniref:Uncharacterized protein n=1 Tax=Caenorhabditis bovis TaxID=2654633 RepID=A0A8S1EHX3_9PELO|nr:unnamed protein product [Caenorhabditis bovis]
MKMMLKSILLALALTSLCSAKAIKRLAENYENEVQAVSVQGRLFCGSKILKGIHVKLIDRDHGDDKDDLLGEAHTDEHGDFHITGGTQESTKIEPAIKIYHDCNDADKKCQKKLFWDIPHYYVTTKLDAISVFDIGSVNLEITFGNEQRDCLH